jgi:GTP-binding protein
MADAPKADKGPSREGKGSESQPEPAAQEGLFDYLDVAFTGSYPRLEDCPAPKHPEYAFIGRSNVGKSSLVNLLSGRKALAKVSTRPGKTQLLNFFWVKEEAGQSSKSGSGKPAAGTSGGAKPSAPGAIGWYLVDLPGYGYAKVSKTQRAAWEKLIRNYLIRRESLACVFLLVDASIPPQQSDLDFADFLGECRVPWALVYTKSDRVASSKRKGMRKAFEERLLEHWDALPPHFTTSSSKKRGRHELLAYIRELNARIAEGEA